MKPYNRQTRLSAPPDRGLFILCGCFALGMLLAYPIQRRVGAEALTQLGTYVQGYARLAEDRVQQPASVLSAAAAYLRYPLLALLCGLSGAGVVLIPLLCGVQGFFLSFSVCCFAASLGREGVLLALAALGLRCLFVLPCMLYLSGAGFPAPVGRWSEDRRPRPRSTGGCCCFVCLCFLPVRWWSAPLYRNFSRLFWRGCLRERGEGI